MVKYQGDAILKYLGQRRTLLIGVFWGFNVPSRWIAYSQHVHLSLYQISPGTLELDRKALYRVLQCVRLPIDLECKKVRNTYLDLRAKTQLQEDAHIFPLLLIGKMFHQLFKLVQILVCSWSTLPGMVSSGPCVIGDKKSIGTPTGLRRLLWYS